MPHSDRETERYKTKTQRSNDAQVAAFDKIARMVQFMQWSQAIKSKQKIIHDLHWDILFRSSVGVSVRRAHRTRIYCCDQSGFSHVQQW